MGIATFFEQEHSIAALELTSNSSNDLTIGLCLRGKSSDIAIFVQKVAIGSYFRSYKPYEFSND